LYSVYLVLGIDSAREKDPESFVPVGQPVSPRIGRVKGLEGLDKHLEIS
jgi:hypothetical protein